MANADDERTDTSSLSGAWVLDVARSDTLEGYLRCQLASELVIQSQMAGERSRQSRNVIKLDALRLIISKDTAVNNYTEEFEIDEEEVTESATGALTSTKVSLAESQRPDGYVLVSEVISEEGLNIIHVEARQVSPCGRFHTQEIRVQNLTAGANCVVRRLWVRVPMTQLDALRLCRPVVG